MRKILRSPFIVSIASVGASLGCGNPGSENPPPPPLITECPALAPEVGAACAPGLLCHYGATDPCEASYVDYTCDAGSFVMQPRPSCNPPEVPSPPPSVAPPEAVIPEPAEVEPSEGAPAEALEMPMGGGLSKP